MKNRFLLLTVLVFGLMLAACKKGEPEKTIVTDPVVAAPTQSPSAEVTAAPVKEDNSGILNSGSLSEGQQEVADVFYEGITGEEIGLANDTKYYKITVGNRYEIMGVECYQISVSDVSGNAVGDFYVSRNGEYVFGYDEAQKGYYVILDESELLEEADSEENGLNEEASAAVALLRSSDASSLGLPASYDMSKCIIQYDGLDEINGNDYFCFFISKDTEFTSYFEYYVSTDYKSLLIYDGKVNQYYDLYNGTYINEEAVDQE